MDNVFLALLPLGLLIAFWVWMGVRFRRSLGERVASPVAGVSPYGVHGVLAFFIFVSYWVAPLFILGQTNNSLMEVERMYPAVKANPGWEGYRAATLLVSVALIATQIWVARGLRNRLVPESLKRAKLMCFALPLAAIVADLVLVSVMMNVQLGDVADNLDGATVGSYVKAIVTGWVWGLYFVLSKRCKNTYIVEPEAVAGNRATNTLTAVAGG